MVVAKRRCGKKKKWKTEMVVAGRPTNLPQSLPTFVPHSHMSPRCLSHRPKAKNVKSNFPFSFFQSSFLFYLEFWIFVKCKDEKSKMLWKRRNIKWWIFGEGENRKNAIGGRKAEKSNMI
jgi:hypothetical protein